MANHYIKFDEPIKENPTIQDGRVKGKLTSLFVKAMSSILPLANPDFEDQIGNVRTWLVEFEDDGVPAREIGLDETGKVIMIMPSDDNCGYWIDNNLTLADFPNHFQVTDITREEFEIYWAEFQQKPNRTD